MLPAPLASLMDDTSAWRLNRVIGGIRAAEWKACIRRSSSAAVDVRLHALTLSGKSKDRSVHCIPRLSSLAW
ncbi:hypothetical protein Q7C36_005425 [Tachysurus vachellii]|uniref:Uncharacterized protein n=1 Tax=Tachysurus vachellii TaxID=175792 RepID=A0AA88NDZ8_TACVA|nr:hypothetical protein Q7C36_005425 [Tachysurus vachellii]